MARALHRCYTVITTHCMKIFFSSWALHEALSTTRWKYIAIRYDEKTQTLIEQGKPFIGWNGVTHDLPFLTRNSHLGFNAARNNPHYFESDQLYDLTNDPREERNVADEHPEQLAEMRSKLRRYLQSFPDRPFGEFTQPMITSYEAN